MGGWGDGTVVSLSWLVHGTCVHAAPLLAGNSSWGKWAGLWAKGGRSLTSSRHNTFRTAEVIYTTSRRQTHVNTTGGTHKKGGVYVQREAGLGERGKRSGRRGRVL